MRRVLLPFMFLGLATAAQAQQLMPFEASYTADWKQLPFRGSAERSLSQTGDNSWKLNFQASMMVAAVSETSTFAAKGNSLYPVSYNYKRTGLGKPKRVKQNFDWQAMSVTGKEQDQPLQLPLKANTLDKSTYQLALQRDVAAGKTTLSYSVLDGDEIDIYDFRILGEEVITTPVGSLNTVKVERVRDPGQNKRKTTLWFAKDWDYLLVQLNQVERDGKEYTISLASGQTGGKQVTGK